MVQHNLRHEIHYCVTRALWSKVEWTEKCLTVLKTWDHQQSGNISRKIRHCHPREKSGFEIPGNPDFRRIRVFQSESGLDRQAFDFCVEKWYNTWYCFSVLSLLSENIFSNFHMKVKHSKVKHPKVKHPKVKHPKVKIRR